MNRLHVRFAAPLALFLGFVLVAGSAAAQTYSMTGRYARSNGVFINIPLIGNNPGGVPNCGYTKAGAGMTMVPGAFPIIHGINSTQMATKLATKAVIPTRFANPEGCIAGAAAMLTATAAGAGKAFTFPAKAFSKPFPGMTNAVSVPLLPNIIQLATSFTVAGPPKTVGTGVNAPGGTMLMFTTMGSVPTNLAMFRDFHKSAWMSQTGRAGPTFTWCPGAPACTLITMGYLPLIVKYTPGPNKFGGTMSHVITSGPNPSSLAVLGFPTLVHTVMSMSVPFTGVRFLPLAGMFDAQPTGRGYADLRSDLAIGGMTLWAKHMTGPVTNPTLGSTQKLITALSYPVMAAAVGLLNMNYGFPFTTGTVLVRNTGTTFFKNPLVVTLTAKGGDTVTAMGDRNISLVAGAVAWTDLDTATPTLNQLFLPEPAAHVQCWAGVVVLLGIAAWRSRRVRARS